MENCSTVVLEYFTYKPLHLLQWSQFLFSVASIIVVTYTIVTYLRKSWFEGVFKETLYALYFCILWHDVFTILLMSFQITTRVTAGTPCAMQFDRVLRFLKFKFNFLKLEKFCLLRVITSFPFSSFMWIHSGITAQRVVTSFTGNRQLHTVVARVSLLIALAYCIGYVLIIYRGYKLQGLTCYCSGFVPGSENIIVTFTFIMMFVDILNVAATYLLIKFNRKKIEQLASAPLPVKFRHRQTIKSIQQMQPVAFFHLFIFTTQYVGFEISRNVKLAEVQLITFNGFFYTMPYYCFICPSILLWLMISERRRKENELRSITNSTSEAKVEGHFSTLQSLWDKHHTLINLTERRHVYQKNRVASA